MGTCGEIGVLRLILSGDLGERAILRAFVEGSLRRKASIRETEPSTPEAEARLSCTEPKSRIGSVMDTSPRETARTLEQEQGKRVEGRRNEVPTLYGCLPPGTL